ncbi:reverse transcriptase domain-containing protein, partial [Tanacetum coccineum]
TRHSSLVVLRNSLELKEQLAYYHSWKIWSVWSTLVSVLQKAKSNSRLVCCKVAPWWNKLVLTKGRAIAIAQLWEDLKKLLIERHCPGNAIEELKEEFWNHVMIGADADKFTTRFHELARLVSHTCMRTRSQSRNLNRQQQAPPAVVGPFNLEDPIENQPPPVVTMADNRTMAQLLEAPTEGYEDAIILPEITVDPTP